jgi:Kef-type K+ transport system membrane component KefB
MAEAASSTPRLRWRAPLWYALMVTGAIGVFLAVRWVGEPLSTTEEIAVKPASEAAVSNRSEALLHMLFALVAVVAAGQLAARIFVWLRQPPVIGEVMAGIALGPSLLGAVSPAASDAILPDDVAPYLAVVAQLGVILYMFTVGLELDVSLLRKRGHLVVAISHASIVAPFVLGAILALALYSSMAPQGVRFTPFALFLAASISITAFPVLARILTDRGLASTELGGIALASAAIGDVTAWCLLAFVVGVAQAQIDEAIRTSLLTLAYLAAMFLAVRPLLAHVVPWIERRGVTKGAASIVFGALLLSAWVTEMIGIHAIFGAFLLGAMIPHDSRIARELPGRFEDIVTIVLLPAFFALTGMRTQIGLIAGWENWLWCGVILLVATVGKFGGSALAARFSGMSWRESCALGALMNTRGLVELIVLNIGLELGVLSPRLFAILVVMALATTLATAPVLQLLGVGDSRRSPLADTR